MKGKRVWEQSQIYLASGGSGLLPGIPGKGELSPRLVSQGHRRGQKGGQATVGIITHTPVPVFANL